MLVVGASGFAKELLEVLYQLDWLDDLAFYDDVSADVPDKLYDRFPILRQTSQANAYFRKVDPRFALGIGRPRIRSELAQRFEVLGGVLSSVISPNADIGHFGTTLGNGTTILTGAIVTNDVTIGKGVLINKKSVITHDCKIGAFAEISVGACLGGQTSVGAFSTMGIGSISVPGVKIGDNVLIGAGAVVTRDIPSGVTAMGVPARIVQDNAFSTNKNSWETNAYP